MLAEEPSRATSNELSNGHYIYISRLYHGREVREGEARIGDLRDKLENEWSLRERALQRAHETRARSSAN